MSKKHAIGTVTCPLFREKIGKTQCQEACSIIRTNEQTCNARFCASPFRFCLYCLRQGYRAHDSVVVDAMDGTCSFHSEHGGTADRSKPLPHEKQSNRVAAQPTSGQVILVPAARIRPLADQPRRYFDAAELAALEKSILRRGQLQPGLVRTIKGDSKHDYELIDGQRRWHACAKLGVPYRAVVTDVADSEDQFEMSIASNFQRADHTPMEIARAIDRLRKRGGRSMDDISTLFGKSLAWCHLNSRLIGLDSRIEELIEPATRERDRLSVTVAYELALLAAVDQWPMLESIRRENLTSGAAVLRIRAALSRSVGGSEPSEGPRKRPRELKARDHYRTLSQYAKRTLAQAAYLGGRLDPKVTDGMRQQYDVKELLRQLNDLSSAIAAISVRLSGESAERAAS